MHRTRLAALALAGLLAGSCASRPTAPPGPRAVVGCRHEPAHHEEAYRCKPNPADPGRLLCFNREELIPERWLLEYAEGELRVVDQETCYREGDLKRWECPMPSGNGYVFVEDPSGCAAL